MVLISLGSNQGNSTAVLLAAIAALRVRAEQDFRCSALFRTSPVDCPPGAPDFVNAVVAFVPRDADSPEQLLAFLQALEQLHGREPSRERNAPRVLDLDLILYGQHTRATDELILPHPRAHLRRFVMVPAATIAPELIWPGGTDSIADICAGLGPAEDVSQFDEQRCQ